MRFLINLAVIIFLFISCKKETPAEPLPVLTMLNTSHLRTTSKSVLQLIATTDKPSSEVVSIKYAIEEATAKAGKDFTSSNGTLTIQPNQKQAILEIPITGDSLRQDDIYLNVRLSNPVNCTTNTSLVAATIQTADGSYLPTDMSGYSTPLSYPNYKLVWNDEFSQKSLDINSWNYETGNNNGWGNAELENYTDRPQNVFLSSGNLIIEARRESYGGFNYTSARLTTQKKRSFKFGRIDIRAKLPVGKGIWPALWMLGENISTVGWPACGEIDIMELIGTFPNRVTGTMHWGSNTANHSSKGADYFLTNNENFSQKFHVFSIVWEKDIIKWYVDDQLFHTNTLATVGGANYPFNAEQFFIFNVAVGGNWPGPPDASTTFPQRMFVDYVRVFQ